MELIRAPILKVYTFLSKSDCKVKGIHGIAMSDIEVNEYIKNQGWDKEDIIVQWFTLDTGFYTYIQ